MYIPSSLKRLLKKTYYKFIYYPHNLNLCCKKDFIAVHVDNFFQPNLCEAPIVIDIGCGNRINYQYFPRHIKYIGLDSPVNPKDHPLYKKKPDIWGDAINLPFKDNVAHFIICTQVLEHICDPIKALREIQRVLTIRGGVLITVPQCYRIHEAPYDFFRFTKFSLMHYLTQFGFKIIDIKPSTNTLITAWNVLLDVFRMPTSNSRTMRFLKIIITTIVMYFLKCLWKIREDCRDAEHPINWLIILVKNHPINKS